MNIFALETILFLYNLWDSLPGWFWQESIKAAMKGEIKEVFETATVISKMRYIFVIILISEGSDVFIHRRLEYEWEYVEYLV